VSDAEALYARAVGAREAVFTTCGSGISIHTAMLTVTGPGRTILVDRNVHKSVVASLIMSGAHPGWLRPCWDNDNQVAHPATAHAVADALDHHPEIGAALMITPTEYGTGADVRAVAKLCHANLALAAHPPTPDRPAPMIPELEDLNLEQVMTPRDAFFAETEQLTDPVGRVSADMVSPYPPGVPAILPGERCNRAVVDYLRAGRAAGMELRDATDPDLNTFQVVLA